MPIVLTIISTAFGYFLVTFVAGKLIALIVRAILRQESDEHLVNVLSRGIVGVGEYIGWLERFLIVSFILVGYYNGIGFILAAKSILRYGEIKTEEDHKFAEYVIVGTLLSFSVAVVLGLILRWTMGLSLQF
jgi:large-conductance mechanosensitive channel